VSLHRHMEALVSWRASDYRNLDIDLVTYLRVTRPGLKDTVAYADHSGIGHHG
jgi:hypothetical protein